MLLGRERERRDIGAVLDRARAGSSAAVALVGEPGIGKTALLEETAEAAADMQRLRARGVESEAQIPFASLLELLRPALGMLERIPEPQAAALEAALALRPGHAQERFAVGAATLSLLAAYAEQGPVAVLIDDAQWLDGSSAQALLFAVRRLIADPVAVLIAVRGGEPSLLDGADLPRLEIGGLSDADAARLLDGVAPEVVSRLQGATGGNPLALLELAAEADSADLELAPEGAPLLVSARISDAFLRRMGQLDEACRRALVLAATSDTGELRLLEAAAHQMAVDLGALAAAESSGLLTMRAGMVEFRHPIARSAIYADAPVDERRAAHRALAAALPDRDVDRRAWHLAAAALGTDESACSALEQAGARSRERSAYATATAAFERAGRLTADPSRRARLLADAAEAAWLAGLADRALRLIEEGRESIADDALALRLEHLAGQIVVRRGPVMRGYEIFTAAAERAGPEEAIEMLAEAAEACFLAAEPKEVVAMAERAQARLRPGASVRARFLVAISLGMAETLRGDAAAGAAHVHEAIMLAESSAAIRDDLPLLHLVAEGPLFLRESEAGRTLVEQVVRTARARAAVGILPFMLGLVALDQATTDRWALAEANYGESIALARESEQRVALAFGLSGLAWLQGRRGREAECRAAAAEALELCGQLGVRLHAIWSLAALGELELGLGHAEAGAGYLEEEIRLVAECGITDVDLLPAPELVDCYLRLGRRAQAETLAGEFFAAAEAKGQPWSLARAWRARGMLAPNGDWPAAFETALQHHAQTPDLFQTARTQLVYGERLRRARNRVLAREQLRPASEAFERLDAWPWANRARNELAASGETLRRRDASARDELTPQELQIAVLLAGGKTTREAAAALFLSPKTIEYHLRHVYLKLGIHSREELADALAEGEPALATAGHAPH